MEHPFFEDIDWENLYLEPRHATFVPRVIDKFDTGYFVQKELGDSFVEGFVHEAGGGRDSLFAGFSWVHMPTMEEVVNDDNTQKDQLEDNSNSSSELAAEIERAAIELNDQSSVNILL